MTTTTTSTRLDATDRDERKRKRAAIIKFSLAGAAVLGIGAAATSAGWTDDAWFSASASAVATEMASPRRSDPERSSKTTRCVPAESGTPRNV